jgi:hypothetical protein
VPRAKAISFFTLSVILSYMFVYPNQQEAF